MELLPFLQFGNQIVIVGVEPLRHLHGAHGPVRLAAGHGEVGFESGSQRPEPFRNRADEPARVEHLVIEAEIVRRNPVDAGGLLQPPVFRAEPPGDGEQFGFGGLARPVRFEGALEFAVRPHAGKTEIVGPDACGHGSFPFLRWRVFGRDGGGCSDSKLVKPSRLRLFPRLHRPPQPPIGFAPGTSNRRSRDGESCLVTAARLWPVFTAFPALPSRLSATAPPIETRRRRHHGGARNARRFKELCRK